MAIRPFPKKVRVMGQRVAFPQVCPHCLQPAAESVEIDSRRTVVGYCNAYSRREYVRIQVPFCRQFVHKLRIAKRIGVIVAVLVCVFVLAFVTSEKNPFMFLVLILAGPAWIPVWVRRPEKYIQLLPTTGESVEIGVVNEQYAQALAKTNGTTVLGWYD